MAGLNMKAGDKSDFKPAPAGNHIAVCTRVIDMGSHFETYQGKPKPHPRHMLRIGWELPTCPMDDGRPFLVSERYTASLMGKTNHFRAMLESWRGKPFDKASQEAFHPKVLLGLPCMVNIVHKDTYANVNGVTPIPKDGAGNPVFPRPEPQGPVLLLELTPEDFRADVFDQLHPKMREFIAESIEFQAMFPGGLWKVGDPAPAVRSAEEVNRAMEQAPAPQGPDDDIPF